MPLKIAATSLSLAALVIGLAIPAVMPEIANIDYFIIAGLAVVLFSLSAPWRQLLARPAVFMPLLAGVLLTVCFIINADAPLDALAAVFFIPLFLVAPMAELFRRSGSSLVTPTSISLAATSGTIAALGLALYDSFVLGLPRAGYTVNNPIHFADITLTLGFVGLVGLYSNHIPVRVLAIGAPLFGLIVVVLSSSRGPLVASVPMALAALAMLTLHFGNHTAFRRALILGATAIAGLTMAAWATGFIDGSAFVDALTTIRGGEVDSSTALRLKMYEGAYLAFAASPVFGHGLIGYIETANQFVPDAKFGGHLHSDIADFAVAGGAVGLLAYGLFLIAPLVEVWKAPAHAATRRAAAFLAVILVVGYAGMGLTNAMFGVLTQTVLFGFCLATVSHLAHAGNTEPDQ